MHDEHLLERARLRFNLSASIVESILVRCRQENVDIGEAMLQLGILSRRQLTNLLGEPVNPQLRDTQEFDAAILHELENADTPKFTVGYERYLLGNEIARGGMGQVVEAIDQNLGRAVAIKLLLDEQENLAWQSRFIQEAQVTGQLQHPSIIPVYDLGLNASGKLYFSMKKVEGVTLQSVFKGLRSEDPNTMARFTRSKLLQTFQMVCLSVAYAHSRSVIHRDIKPANIMIGEFGEVFLVDWGLAKVLDREADDGKEKVKSHRGEEGRMTTRQGEAIGTPGYMSPELALGQQHFVDERADIYALGSILYEILTLRRPYGGKDVRTMVQRMLKMPVTPASQRAPGRDVPEQLEKIASRCLERDISLRYRSVLDLCRDFQGFMENHLGARSRANSLVHAMEPSLNDFIEAREALEATRARLAELSLVISPWSRLEARRELWQIQKQLSALEQEADQLFIGLSQDCAKKLSKGTTSHSLISVLGSVLKTELTPPVSTARALESEKLIRDFKRWPSLEHNSGRFAIRCDRENINILMGKAEEVDGIVQAVEWKSLGSAPAVIDGLEEGTYMVRVSDQRVEFTAPMKMPRVGDTTVDVPFSIVANVPDNFRAIFANTAVVGGDNSAFWSMPRQDVQIQTFAMARTPVTFGAYILFLNAIAAHDINTALTRCPRTESSRLIACVNETFSLPRISPFESTWDRDWPVFGISWDDAKAYCEWMGHQDGRSYRLPSSVEWEVAGRGVDERIFPWGNIWEPSFSNNALEQPGSPRLTSVGNHPTDMSPFGVMDMAGGVAEWTSTELEDPEVGPIIVCRGGSWTRTDRDARLASRHPMFPDAVSRRVGFRLVLDL